MFVLTAVPARSPALFMEESPEGSLPAGSRVWAAGSTVEEVYTAAGVEAFTVAEVTQAEVTGNSGSFLEGNLRNGERNHAHHKSDHRNRLQTEAQLGGCPQPSGITDW